MTVKDRHHDEAYLAKLIAYSHKLTDRIAHVSGLCGTNTWSNPIADGGIREAPMVGIFMHWGRYLFIRKTKH